MTTRLKFRLVTEDLALPLTAMQVLIKVHAVALNYCDVNIAISGNPWPVIPHGIFYASKMAELLWSFRSIPRTGFRPHREFLSNYVVRSCPYNHSSSQVYFVNHDENRVNGSAFLLMERMPGTGETLCDVCDKLSRE